MLRRVAPAKLNLALHITGKRADGYHELETLVAFTDLADTLAATPSGTLSLHVTGPFVEASGSGEDNLVIKAARALQVETGTKHGAALTLTKNIPAGAGLGGGSADAAAALLLLSELWGVKANLKAIALTLGADVAMFLQAPAPLIARGIGEQIEPLTFALPPLYAVLVYPNKKLATAQVYGAYRPENHTQSALTFSSAGGLLNGLAFTRNDLQRPAITVLAEVAEVLLALETASPKPSLVRMSGSGSCCFALYGAASEAQEAAARLRGQYPHWWVKEARLLT